MCPRGEIEIVDFFLEDAKSQLSSKVKSSISDFDSLRGTEKIIKITEVRLMMTAPIIKQWPQVKEIILCDSFKYLIGFSIDVGSGKCSL